MSFLPPEIVQRLALKYKPNSIKTFNTNIKKIFLIGLSQDEFNYDDLENKQEEIIDYINLNIDKTSVRKSMIIAIMAIVKNNEFIHDSYKKYFRIAIKEHDDAYIYKRPTTEMKLKWIRLEKQYENLLTFDETFRLSYREMIRNIFRLLYLYIPPLRGMEYATMLRLGIDRTNTKNYYTGKYFIINDHKTMKSYGQKKIKVPLEVRKFLDKMIKINRTKYGDNLFLTRMSKPYSQSDITFLLNSTFDFSIDMLRKIYVAEIIKYITEKYRDDEMIKKRIMISKIMGHSIRTQEFTYRGFSHSDVRYSSTEFMDDLWKVSFL